MLGVGRGEQGYIRIKKLAKEACHTDNKPGDGYGRALAATWQPMHRPSQAARMRARHAHAHARTSARARALRVVTPRVCWAVRCKGGPKVIQTCGPCGILSDSCYPTGAFLKTSTSASKELYTH